MPEGQVLEFTRVTKQFGAVTAVSDLSVRVEPGLVTGFLGPNGAGKTTSLRIMLGQIKPTSGTATIGGQNYSELRHPLRTIGAVLEEAAYRPRRTAARQLLIAAKANGIPNTRVDEVLRMVGLQDDADTRLGSYSLGMRQRLAVANALLGDPGVLVFDEPANSLDPEGIRWMRLLMRRLADEGRTVLLSSHVLSEIEQVADNVVVLSKGRAVYSGGIAELADPTGGAVIVDAANRAPLITALSAAKLEFDVLRSGVTVRNSDAATVGAVTAAAGVPLTMLQQRGPSLEEVFLDLVYGRRSDSPRLDEVANPVAHAQAPKADDEMTDVADAALIASGVPGVGAAAVMGAALATGAVPTVADDSSDAAKDAEPDAAEGAEPDAAEPDAAVTDEATGPDAPDEGALDEDAPADDAIVEDPQGAEEPTDDAGEDVTAAEDTAASDSATSDENDAPDDDAEQAADAADSASASVEDSDLDDDADDDGAAAIAALWAPRSADATTGEVPVSAESEDQSDAQDEVLDEDTAAEASGDASEVDDATRPQVLPLATEAVTIPVTSDVPTFTELITGLPSSVAEGIGEPAPATEAIPVTSAFTITDDDDEDSSVDDDEDDPRLAAMRTSLSSAASRFFDGPAPDYPYSKPARSAEQSEETPESDNQ